MPIPSMEEKGWWGVSSASLSHPGMRLGYQRIAPYSTASTWHGAGNANVLKALSLRL